MKRHEFDNMINILNKILRETKEENVREFIEEKIEWLEMCVEIEEEGDDIKRAIEVIEEALDYFNIKRAWQTAIIYYIIYYI